MSSDSKHSLASAKRLERIPIMFDELGLTQLSASQLDTIAQIDACLPQTQCGLCSYNDGCLPYAHAIVVNDEQYNKCIPGGQDVTDKIADIIDKPSIDVLPSKWQVSPQTQRPYEVRAVINEQDCIGCTKCIPACPVDAIIGTGKHMHTVLTDLCTGCELCLVPCPVDCIDLVVTDRILDKDQRLQEQSHLRQRYHHHLNRVTAQINDKRNNKPVISMVQNKLNNTTNTCVTVDEDTAKNTIAMAKLRTKIKKLEKQLTIRDNEKKRQELIELQSQLTELDNSTTIS